MIDNDQLNAIRARRERFHVFANVSMDDMYKWLTITPAQAAKIPSQILKYLEFSIVMNERKQARIAKLEAALREIDNKVSLTPYGIGGPSAPEIAAVIVGVKKIARRALESEGE